MGRIGPTVDGHESVPESLLAPPDARVREDVCPTSKSNRSRTHMAHRTTPADRRFSRATHDGDRRPM
ncbi:hypothetical protein [Halalkalicoccus paucihalophilus]|uniref:hypothetical protein n=1 Tax=Halalkalicoccus paucihalophilus TaxID=1008153 RepID=UPI0008328C63|nr:hypothetical protein [Halalkalicoccus paucihalophilus]